MKKILSFILLGVLSIGNLWAQDVTVATFENTTKANYFKDYTVGLAIVSVSVTSSLSSGNGGIYADISSSSSSINSNYFGVSVSDGYIIEKIAIYATGSGNSKSITAPFIGWEEGWDGTSTSADYGKTLSYTTPSSNGGKIATAEWYETDFSSWNAKEIRLYKKLSGITIPEYELPTGGETVRIWGFKIWIASASTDPKITADNTASIVATESGVEATEDIAVTGTYLTGSTLTATLTPAVDGLSVTLGSSTITAGAISTTATLHYTQTENASGSTTLTLSDGTTTKDIIVNYNSSVVDWTLQSISEAKSWDFATLSGGKQYSGDDLNIEHVYANIAEITCPNSFDATALAFTGEYPLRSGKAVAQNGTLHFNTTVAGSIVVKFSDTGTSASTSAVKRYLVVNGESTEYWASRENNNTDPEVAYDAQLNVTSGAIHVPAGDVTISGTSALVYQKLEFYPDVDVTLGANGYSTYAADFKYTVSGATVYKAAYNGSNAVVLTEVVDAVVPANQGIILKGTEGATATITLSNDDASDFSGNGLVGVVAPLAASAGMYVLSTNAGVTEFNPCQAGVMIPAHKAYISIPSNAPAIRIIEANNGATNIDNLEGAEEAVKFIENGQLFIKKNGKIYNAVGAIVM